MRKVIIQCDRCYEGSKHIGEMESATIELGRGDIFFRKKMILLCPEREDGISGKRNRNSGTAKDSVFEKQKEV